MRKTLDLPATTGSKDGGEAGWLKLSKEGVCTWQSRLFLILPSDLGLDSILGFHLSGLLLRIF